MKMATARKTLLAVLFLWLITVGVVASEPACNTVRTTLTAYDSAIEMYASEHGLPEDEHWFETLVHAGLIQHHQPRNDPWGHPYYYRVIGNTYDLRTLGPDGELGTDDDQVRENGWRWKSCSPSFSGWPHC